MLLKVESIVFTEMILISNQNLQKNLFWPSQMEFFVHKSTRSITSHLWHLNTININASKWLSREQKVTLLQAKRLRGFETSVPVTCDYVKMKWNNLNVLVDDLKYFKEIV